MWHIQRNEYRPRTSRYAQGDETRAVHFVILDEDQRVIASVDWMPAHPRSLKEAQAHAEEIVQAHNARKPVTTGESKR
jgi:hypothetical protein